MTQRDVRHTDDIDQAIERLSAEHPENPLLGPYYPYVTAWRCPACQMSTRIAAAKQREWCMHCPDASPLTLMSPPLATTAEPV